MNRLLHVALAILVASASSMLLAQTPDPSASPDGFMEAAKDVRKPINRPTEESGPTTSQIFNLGAASERYPPGTVGDILQNGGKVLSRNEVSSTFANGGEWSGLNVRGETFKDMLSSDQSYTGQSGGSTYSGNWRIDEQGRLCMSRDGMIATCAHLLEHGIQTYIALSATDPSAQVAERSFVSFDITTGPSTDASAQGASGRQASVEQTQTQTSSADNAGKKTPLTWAEKFLWLTLFGTAVSLLALLIAGITGTVVVFYDWKDFTVTMFIFIAGFFGFVITGIIADGAPDYVAYWGFGITALAVIGLSIKTMQLSILHNRSVPVGIIVGLFKVFLALFSIFFVFGKLGEISNEKSSGATKLAAIAILGIFIWVLNSLVNGKRVYEKRGWALPRES